MSDWNPDMNAAPRDGTDIDLWIWRSDRTVTDCYFPKMSWHEDGYWWNYEDAFETQLGHADFWRHITPPATP